MDVTVLKLELPDAQFNAPFSGTSTGEGDEDQRESMVGGTDDESDGSGMSGIVGLGVLLVFAALAWYLRSGRGPGMGRDAEDVMPEGHA